MKKRVLRKALLLVASGLMLVSVTVGATLAYLTDTHSVVNTFTVGNVGLSISESKVTEYGVPDGTSRVTQNSYKLLPGQYYVKDPLITIDDDSEDGWLFVRVDNPIAPIEADTSTIADQMDKNGWKAIAENSNVYAYEETVSADKEIEVFESFTISGEADNATLAAYENKQIVVTAYLVQAAGFNTAADAWAAVADQLGVADDPSTSI